MVEAGDAVPEAASAFLDIIAIPNEVPPVPMRNLMSGSKATILVNVASAWGLTDRHYRQYKAMYDTYNSRGLQIIAVPCNQFGA